MRRLYNEKVLIICNFEETLDIQTEFKTVELLLSNYNGRTTLNGIYHPFEIAVYKL